MDHRAVLAKVHFSENTLNKFNDPPLLEVIWSCACEHPKFRCPKTGTRGSIRNLQAYYPYVQFKLVTLVQVRWTGGMIYTGGFDVENNLLL